MRTLIGTFLAVAILSNHCWAANYADQIQSAATEGKYAYLVFYRANDAATQQMANAVQTHVNASSGQATWMAVDVNQPSSADLVKRFDASRMPLPAVVGLAPNGAVTGVFPGSVQSAQLESAILTPLYSEMIKALQSQKIALVCVQPAAGGYIPAGVAQFENDANFQGHTTRVAVSVNDPSEAKFIRELRVRTDITSPVVYMFAPPGVFLGSYNANVSAATLASKMHSSGKCNCEKCRQQR